MSPSGARVPAAPADVEAVLMDVSAARLRADVDRLAGFGTRHTRSDLGPDHGHPSLIAVFAQTLPR